MRADEERYQLICQAVAEGIYEWNIETNALSVSPRLLEIFGFQGSGLTAADWNSIIHPDDFRLYQAALRNCFRGITARLDCEYRVRHSDGAYRWIEDRGVPVRNAAGRAVRMVGAVSDITERKATEQALRASEERHALAMWAINEGVYEWDVSTGEMYYSPRVCKLLGLTPEELRTMADWTNRIHPDDLAGFRAAIVAHFKGETEWLEYEYRYRHADGTWHWARHHGVALKDKAGRAYRVVGSTGDITERKEVEQALREALEQQTATAEVLGVINASPGDLKPIFAAMLERAVQLCEAHTAHLLRYDGKDFSRAASLGVPEDFDRILPLDVPMPDAITKDSIPTRLLAARSVVHVHDLREDASYLKRAPAEVAAVEQAGIRTVLFVPLLKEGLVVGCFIMHRMEVRPFSEKQIALLENFAAQAVVAMENARLLTETREALERQTATAEILRVISSSPTDVQPTFDAIAAAATTLSGAVLGGVFTYDGSLIHFVADYGWTPEEAAVIRATFPIPPGRGSVTARAIETRAVAHIEDMSTDPDFAYPALAATGGHTVLAVPMLRDGAPIGAINVQRRHVELFSDKQIDLLKTFADQAVIAIENVRLFNELNERTHDLEESLKYQTATSDVLQVISRSTFDLQPVLDTLLQAASRLCGNAEGALAVRQGEVFRYVATVALTPDFDAALRQRVLVADHGSTLGRVVLEGRVVHIPDVAADPLYALPEVLTLGKLRTTLGVPLLRDGEAIGVITLAHRRVEPFTERQIELVRTFADQAVIALENARLLTELRESLEQQQAIADVLRVINASPGNLQPVFGAILEKAHALCGATLGSLFLFDGEVFRAAATHGYPEELAEQLRQGISRSYTSVGEPLLAGARLVHNPDLMEIDDPLARAVAERGGVRTNLLLPLRKDDTLLGTITCNRAEVRPFSEKEIALLENFAAQAVIAMDNARLLDEIRHRQAELRVTFDSMGDGVAMFDAEMRLAAWNTNFQKILDLPDEFVGARPTLQEYFQYMYVRGEYGTAQPELEAEIRRGIAIADHQSRFERTRPDGRVIEVRRNAVPGGGSVLIFSDITERKRAEEEIRAARDTAEAALTELKTAQANLIQAEKMASLGQLTAGIAHEIKNPLNFVNNFAGLSVELLDELKEAAAPGIAQLDDDTRAEIDETVEMLTGNLEKIAEHGRRADGIVKSMLEHSRGASGERRPVDLNALVEEALNLAYHGARAQDQNFNITLERDFAASIAPVELVPQDVTRVFLNLFGNGFYAANKRPATAAEAGFKPTLKVTTRDLGDAVEITVRDNGIGMTADVKDKLFQPFFTTKPTGEGTGLGLSITYDIVTQQHGGTITVDSQLDQFTEFTVRFPRAAATGMTRRRVGTDNAAASGGP